MPGCQHRGIVVFTHHPIGDEHRIQRHRYRLHRQDNNHRQRQRSQFPELEAHQRHGEEQRQADVAQHRHRAIEHPIQPRQRQAVAEDHADKQHADKGRQFKDTARQQLRNHLAHRQTDGDQGDTLDQHQRGDHPPHVRLFEGGRRHLIVRRPVRRGRVFHQVTRHRAADQAAEHQAESRAGHRHLGGVGKTIALNEQLAPCRPGAVAAGKGNRTGQQTHQRIQAQQLRHADTEGVLQQQQTNHHNQKGTQYLAASPQAGQVGVQTDGGEERQHQRIFEAHIEINIDIHTFFQHQQRQRHQQTAGNRFRNGVFLEEGYGLDEFSAE